MISLISLIIDIFLSFYISKKTLLIPLLTLVSLIYLKKDKYYLLKCMIFGFIYDLIFTDTLFLHMMIFLLLGYLINLFYKHYNFKLLNNIILTILIITLYQLLLFLIFNLINYQNININDFIFIIKHYYLINIIYSIILSIIYKIKS